MEKQENIPVSFQGLACKMCNKKIHLWLHLDIGGKQKSADFIFGKRRTGDVVQLGGIKMNICWNVLFSLLLLWQVNPTQWAFKKKKKKKMICFDFELHDFRRQSIRSSRFMAEGIF